MSDSRENHVTRTGQISSCKSESTFWKKEYTNKINYHIIMFWFCGLIQIWLPLGGVALEKKILELKLEKYFRRIDWPRCETTVDYSNWRWFTSSSHFVHFVWKKQKKKWDYKRERSKEKIFNKKKREKTIKKKNNNKADLANG